MEPATPAVPCLYIFAGLPGTGKSTLAAALAHHLCACYLRIVTIEQRLRDCCLTVDGPAGYSVAYGLAADNLRLGVNVVADSVNPLAVTRQAWREVAAQATCRFVEIEIVCSDQEEHRRRIETRQSNIPRLQLPQWHDVVGREYHQWETSRIVTDTAGQSPEQSFDLLLKSLAK